MDSAITLFAKLAEETPRADERLGNVIGLNPFHDFEAWHALKLSQELNLSVPRNSVKEELQKIEQTLRLAVEKLR